MHFGVVMPTYRADDGTPGRLRRTLASLRDQTHTDWRLYLVGDRYEPAAELAEVAEALIPAGKLVLYNLPRAIERETLRGWELWHCGGVTANNVALTLQERDGVQYTCHLDHDDLWLPNHLQTLAKAYTDFPRAAFVYTRACYETIETVYDLPDDDVPVGYDNLLPQTTRIVHATASWRLDWMPVRYAVSRDQPADAVMWHRLKLWCQRKQLPMVHVPRVTVIKQSKEADRKVRQWKREAMAQGIYQPPR